MKTLLSPGAVVRSVSDTVCRFPLAVAAVIVGAVLFLMAIHDFEINYRWVPFLGVTVSAGVACVVAFEERSRLWGHLAGVGVTLLWGVRCLLLPVDEGDLSMPQGVEIGVVTMVAFLSSFFVAFLRRDTDAQWWNFAARMLVRLALGAIFSGILFGGFLLAIHAMAELFDFDPPAELFNWLTAGCFIIFAPLYVMAGIPSGDAKHDSEQRPAPVLKVLALYILGPILAVYTLILYAYLLKIVFTWQLPDGWVSWLVTTLGAGGLAVMLLIWPLRMRGENRAAELLGRWMGVVIAPLLVLMTVGIARRISDYGFTPNRCYILLLNIWFYGIYAWLFVVRGRRVKWIVISAVVVALLSSVGPWSLARVTPRADKDKPYTTETMSSRTEAWKAWSSDSTLQVNTLWRLDHSYTGFMDIFWYTNASQEIFGKATLSVEEGDMVIRLTETGREFRVPFDQVTKQTTVRGDDFVFIVGSCYGNRSPDSGEIEVHHLEGYLFYNDEP